MLCCRAPREHWKARRPKAACDNRSANQPMSHCQPSRDNGMPPLSFRFLPLISCAHPTLTEVQSDSLTWIWTPSHKQNRRGENLPTRLQRTEYCTRTQIEQLTSKLPHHPASSRGPWSGRRLISIFGTPISPSSGADTAYVIGLFASVVCFRLCGRLGANQ